jgi:type IV secretion system protein VirB9
VKPIVMTLLALAAPVAALAQELPPLPPPPGPYAQPGTSFVQPSSSFQTIDYVPDQVFRLRAAPGYQLLVEFAPDEHIENVAVGDSGAWQISANKRGDRLFVKPLQDGIATNMTVVTDARLYAFELEPLSGPEPGMAYLVRFRYPAPASATPPSSEPGSAGHYKLRGAGALMPSGMHDDGAHTYIDWPEDRPIPAIYAVDERGQETLVNGMMRGGQIVIDSVHSRLAFRIDKRKATARRIEAQEQ